QDPGLMYYCNTCSQPLCSSCRELTHSARMFSHHEIVSMAKRTKAKHTKCSLHEEAYILFSTENKSLLCIKCFRDMQVKMVGSLRESRTHCIDIETAYVQGCEMLDQAVLVSLGGLRRALAAPRVNLVPPASIGGEGAADLSTRGHRPAQSHDRRSLSQCGGGRDGNLLPLQQFAGESS
ncbi:unnamed protein product, partial [Tetraodon nigroviridis]